MKTWERVNDYGHAVILRNLQIKWSKFYTLQHKPSLQSPKKATSAAEASATVTAAVIKPSLL